MFFLILILFLIISSFVLFITSRHDFVLLRQNISIRLVFDKAFLIILFSLLLSRTFYLIDERLYDFFIDPLRFLHVILYWGFNFLGLFLGIALAVLFLFRKRKNKLRILDIYLLSFFPLLFFQAITYLVLGTLNVIYPIMYLIILVAFFAVFIRMYTGYTIKDGVVSFGVLIISASSYLSYSLLSKTFSISSPIQIIAMIAVAISIYCLILLKLDFFKEK